MRPILRVFLVDVDSDLRGALNIVAVDYYTRGEANETEI